MKILITGGSGLLGTVLNLKLSEENEILTQFNRNSGNCKNFKNAQGDLCDFKFIDLLFDEFKPDAVVHTAGITRPEVSDEMPYNEVYKINAGVTKYIAQHCERINALMIFTSTDLVYDGSGSGLINEGGEINPLSNYALSKYDAENEIKNVFDNYIVLRLSLLFGFGYPYTKCNFQMMYNKFLKSEKVNLFYDQYRTPLSLLNAAEIILFLCKSDIKSVTMNCGGLERVSRAGLGERLCDIAGFDRELINRISLFELKNIKPVKDVSLSTDFIRLAGAKIYTLDESIKRELEFNKNNTF